MEKKIDRFDKYMRLMGLNDNKVTKDLNLSVGNLGKSRKENRDLSDRNIEKILNFYIDINKTWLLTGEGPMLKSKENNRTTSGVDFSEKEIEKEPTNIETPSNQIDVISKMLAHQDRLISLIEESQNIIKDLVNQANVYSKTISDNATTIKNLSFLPSEPSNNEAKAG